MNLHLEIECLIIRVFCTQFCPMNLHLEIKCLTLDFHIYLKIECLDFHIYLEIECLTLDFLIAKSGHLDSICYK